MCAEVCVCVFVYVCVFLFWCRAELWYSVAYSLSLWLLRWRPPAQDPLCWRISAHVFLVDLWMAASYFSYQSTTQISKTSKPHETLHGLRHTSPKTNKHQTPHMKSS